MIAPTVRLLAFALAVAVAAAQGQDSAAPKKTGKLSEWPALDAATREKVPVRLGQLKKDKEELRAPARQALITIGAAATPLLLQALTDRTSPINDELFSVFDATLTKDHAALLARESKKSKLELRRYTMRRLCAFVDPDMKPVLAAAAKDADEEVAFSAQLGLAALRDTAALLQIVERCRSEWEERRPTIAAVLPAARCEACGRAVAEQIGTATPPVKAAALRVMRYVATKEQAGLVKLHLGNEDHNVKKEAVNAMRVLYGMEPIENLDAFQAINMAKEWESK